MYASTSSLEAPTAAIRLPDRTFFMHTMVRPKPDLSKLAFSAGYQLRNENTGDCNQKIAATMDMSDFGQVFVCFARIAQRAVDRSFRAFLHVAYLEARCAHLK